MEVLLQYLDDLDDLYGLFGLIGEKLRSILFTAVSLALMAATAVSGVWLATVHLPLAVATVILLFVALLYRSVTAPRQTWQATA